MDLSILLVQYRPDEGELRRTLASLLRQSCRGFELVVADDGSDEDFFPLTRKILAENGFTGAKFVKLTPNGGTVKNVLNGAKQAAGKWVFTVSPGDYLYDADTVAWLLEVLRRDAPRVAFGRLACYADRNGAPIRRPGDAPFDRTPYRPGAYDAKTAKRNMLLYDDGISGAGLVYERELLVQALEKMAGRVLLAEDFAAGAGNQMDFSLKLVVDQAFGRPVAVFLGVRGSTNERYAFGTEQRNKVGHDALHISVLCDRHSVIAESEKTSPENSGKSCSARYSSTTPTATSGQTTPQMLQSTHFSGCTRSI